MNMYSRAFTLLELLLVIALVGLLIALFGVQAQRVRSKARDAAELTSLRQHAAIFSQYSSDFKDLNPYYTNPAATASVVRSLSADIAVAVPYFSTHVWNIALADLYYDGNPRAPMFRSAHNPAQRWSVHAPTDFQYPCTFIARPEYFNHSTRELPPRHFLPTRTADVLYPFKKALLVNNLHPDGTSYGSDGSVRASFTDGHAQVVARSQAGRSVGPVHIGLGEFPTFAALPGGDTMIDTLDGVRGMDVR
jgi:prepilin-type N-terminal cleavage/methylation domain-containing protein